MHVFYYDVQQVYYSFMVSSKLLLVNYQCDVLWNTEAVVTERKSSYHSGEILYKCVVDTAMWVQIANDVFSIVSEKENKTFYTLIAL